MKAAAEAYTVIKQNRNDAAVINIAKAWGFDFIIFPALNQIAARRAISLSDLCREILYNYYQYKPGNKTTEEIQYNRKADTYTWSLPVEKEFWIMFLEKVTNHNERMAKAYRMCVCDAFISYLAGMGKKDSSKKDTELREQKDYSKLIDWANL